MLCVTVQSLCVVVWHCCICSCSRGTWGKGSLAIPGACPCTTMYIFLCGVVASTVLQGADSQSGICSQPHPSQTLQVSVWTVTLKFTFQIVTLLIKVNICLCILCIFGIVSHREAQEDMRKERGEELSYPVLAFHGTNEANITPICENGFKVPGEGVFEVVCSAITSVTNTGTLFDLRLLSLAYRRQGFQAQNRHRLVWARSVLQWIPQLLYGLHLWIN